MQPNLQGKRGRSSPALLSGFTLKCIAILAMAADHTAGALIEEYYSPLGTALHFIGRLTAPIMFYFIVEGYHHTHSKNLYTLRMALFALLSWLPFSWYANSVRPFSRLPQGAEWLSLNVIYTLLLGLLALRVWNELKLPALVQMLVTAVLLVLSLPGDWSYTAVISILMFDAFRGDFKRQALAFGAVVLLRLMPIVGDIYTITLNGYQGYDLGLYARRVLVTAGMLAPLLLLWLYNGKRGGNGSWWQKWLFYIFYPLHLLVLAWLRAGYHA